MDDVLLVISNYKEDSGEYLAELLKVRVRGLDTDGIEFFMRVRKDGGNFVR